MPPRSSVSVLTNYLWFMKWGNDRTIQRAVICQSTRIISTCTLHLIYRTFFAFFINNISHNWSHLSSSLSGKNATVNRNIASACLAVAASCSKKHNFNNVNFYLKSLLRVGGRGRDRVINFVTFPLFNIPTELGEGTIDFVSSFFRSFFSDFPNEARFKIRSVCFGATPC